MKKVKQAIVVGNWKMNPRTLAEAIDCAKKIARNIPKKSPKVILAVPAPFIKDIHKAVKLPIAMQRISTEEEGAYTGDVSAPQGMSAGATYTLIGHSEDRARGATHDIVSKQVETALTLKLPFILCVGESARDKDGTYLETVNEQLHSALKKLAPRHLSLLTIAYEPVWAIGKDATKVATSAECLEVVISIRRFLSDVFGAKKTEGVAILYGGSVSPETAKMFVKEGGVQGLLVGRESLKPKHFVHIINEVAQV